MIHGSDLKPNDDGQCRVVQLKPGASFFGGCFAIVVEPKDWGAIVEILIPSRDEGVRIAPYRATWEDMAFIGWTRWSPMAVAEGGPERREF